MKSLKKALKKLVTMPSGKAAGSTAARPSAGAAKPGSGSAKGGGGATKANAGKSAGKPGARSAPGTVKGSVAKASPVKPAAKTAGKTGAKVGAKVASAKAPTTKPAGAKGMAKDEKKSPHKAGSLSAGPSAANKSVPQKSASNASQNSKVPAARDSAGAGKAVGAKDAPPASNRAQAASPSSAPTPAAKSPKVETKIDAPTPSLLTRSGSADTPDEEPVLTDADGRRYCRVKDCDQAAVVEGYCRYHYLLLWKKIQVRKKILSEGKLERYIEELTARYPDKYLEMLRKDLKSEKDFTAAIQELELDETSMEGDYEDESNSGFIEEVRGMSEGGSVREDDDSF